MGRLERVSCLGVPSTLIEDQGWFPKPIQLLTTNCNSSSRGFLFVCFLVANHFNFYLFIFLLSYTFFPQSRSFPGELLKPSDLLPHVQGAHNQVCVCTHMHQIKKDVSDAHQAYGIPYITHTST